MSAKYYSKFALQTLNLGGILVSYKRLARKIGKFENDARVEFNIIASLNVGTFASPIGLSVKLHKPIGEQSLRTTHKGYNVSFGGLAKWVQKTLEPIVESISWCYKDTFSVRNALLSVPVNASAVIAKIDLTDSSSPENRITLARWFPTFSERPKLRVWYKRPFSCFLIISLL